MAFKLTADKFLDKLLPVSDENKRSPRFSPNLFKGINTSNTAKNNSEIFVRFQSHLRIPPSLLPPFPLVLNYSLHW